MALAEGNELINNQIDKQINGQTKTAILQNTIAAEFNQIHKWEKKYNSYLKTAKWLCILLSKHVRISTSDGVRIFITLGKLRKCHQQANPQGIVASMSMNNLYVETSHRTGFRLYTAQRRHSKGGTENMLTGAERSKTLWALNDKTLCLPKRKLNALYLSIRYYTMTDVWNRATAGMIDRDNSEVANIALDRWRRAAALTR